MTTYSTEANVNLTDADWPPLPFIKKMTGGTEKKTIVQPQTVVREVKIDHEAFIREIEPGAPSHFNYTIPSNSEPKKMESEPFIPAVPAQQEVQSKGTNYNPNYNSNFSLHRDKRRVLRKRCRFGITCGNYHRGDCRFLHEKVPFHVWEMIKERRHIAYTLKLVGSQPYYSHLVRHCLARDGELDLSIKLELGIKVHCELQENCPQYAPELWMIYAWNQWGIRDAKLEGKWQCRKYHSREATDILHQRINLIRQEMGREIGREMGQEMGHA